MDFRQARQVDSIPIRQVRRVLDYIQENLDGALGLDELAAVAQFSQFHFHRLFTGVVGESLKAHVRRLRLERAAHQLRHTDEEVVQIAFSAGYETQESFTRAFKSVFAEPPARYRKAHGKNALLFSPANVHFDAEGKASSFTPIMNSTNHNITIEQRPAMRGVGIRHVGPYQEVGLCFEELSGWVGQRGLFGPSTVVFGMSYDDPEITPHDKLRFDACIAVADGAEFELDGVVQAVEVPAGEYVTMLHEGPYTRLVDTYKKLVGEWLPASRREILHSPSLELYLNDPCIVEEDELQTLVCFALAPDKRGTSK